MELNISDNPCFTFLLYGARNFTPNDIKYNLRLHCYASWPLSLSQASSQHNPNSTALVVITQTALLVVITQTAQCSCSHEGCCLPPCLLVADASRKYGPEKWGPNTDLRAATCCACFILRRAAKHLMSMQQANGDWPQQTISGVFNHNCMITYANYRCIDIFVACDNPRHCFFVACDSSLPSGATFSTQVLDRFFLLRT